MSQKARHRLIDLFLIVAAGILIYFLLKYAFFLIFPIFLAFLFSEGIRKSLQRLTPLSPVTKRILTVLVLLIFFSLLSLITVLFAERVIHYTTSFASFLSKNMENIARFCKDKAVLLEETLSRFLRTDIQSRFTLYLPDIFGKFLQRIIEYVPGWVGSFAAFIPRFFISSIIFLVSCYYFSCDWTKISNFLTKKISKEKADLITRLKKQFFVSLTGFIKAYLLLFLLSFSQLFLGLVLLRVHDAFGIAFSIAIIDLLPVLGCGTVLVPWSLILFLTGKTGMGIGILALYLIILVVRQLAEPKIVGSSIGLHPLISLLLVIIGLRFFGFCGMVLFPLCASCLIEIKKDEPKKE